MKNLRGVALRQLNQSDFAHESQIGNSTQKGARKRSRRTRQRETFVLSDNSRLIARRFLRADRSNWCLPFILFRASSFAVPSLFTNCV
jgi:hypothetical protein